MTRGMGQKSVLGFKHIFMSMGKCKDMKFQHFQMDFHFGS